MESIKTNSDGDKVVECMASEYKEEYTSFEDVANEVGYDCQKEESETTFGIMSYDVKVSVGEFTRVNLDVLINKTGSKRTLDQVQELIDLISKQENVRSRTRGVK